MGKLRVLMYHKVDVLHRDYLTVTHSQLRRQLEHLKSNYRIIRLSDVLAHLREGKPLPEKALLISFDDGYENNFKLAWPLFREMEIPFVIFPVADFIGQETAYDGEMQRFISPEHIKDMSVLAEFGYHGFRHASMNSLDAPGKAEEISKTIEKMESLGIPVQAAWAYTYGAYPRRSKTDYRVVSELFAAKGIAAAFRIGNRVNKLPLKKPYAIQRIDIRGNESHLVFSLKVRFGKVL